MLKVSVIIPTYCPGNYIWQCLDSLCRQTLSKEEFEVIIVLNGCDEPYLSMLKDGLSTRQTLQARLIHIEQGGVSNARNTALDVATGEYVCFIDDDDWVTDTYLETLIKVASNDCVTVSDVMDYDEDQNETKAGYIHRAYMRATQGKRISLAVGRSFMSSSCCKLIPRVIIADHRFDTHFRLGEDSLFMASLSSSLSGVVVSASDAVYFRRLRGKSASRKTMSRWERAKYAIRLSKEYIRMYLSDVRRNNLSFFLSRVIACLMKIFKSSWI